MQCQRESETYVTAIKKPNELLKLLSFPLELAYGSEVYWYLFCEIGQQRLWCSIPALTVRVSAQEKPGNLRNATEGHNLSPNTVSQALKIREDDDVISTLQ
jgi:hypothetical protein